MVELRSYGAIALVSLVTWFALVFKEDALWGEHNVIEAGAVSIYIRGMQLQIGLVELLNFVAEVHKPKGIAFICVCNLALYTSNHYSQNQVPYYLWAPQMSVALGSINGNCSVTAESPGMGENCQNGFYPAK